jgi:hypothetical protein
MATHQAQQRTQGRAAEASVRNSSGASAAAAGPTAGDLICHILREGIAPAEFAKLTRLVRILTPSNDSPIDPCIRAAMAEGEEQAFCAAAILIRAGYIRTPAGSENYIHAMAPETDDRIPKRFPEMRGGYLSPEERVTVLVDFGIDVNGQNEFGETPLHVAAKQPRPNTNLLSALLAHGANSAIRDRNGLSATDAWAQRGFTWETTTRNH